MSRGSGRSADRGFGQLPTERFLSFPPASHAYEHSGGQYSRSAWGRRFSIPKGLEKASPRIFEETRPTIMVAFRATVRSAAHPHHEGRSKSRGKVANFSRWIARSNDFQHTKDGKKRLRDKPLDFLVEKTPAPQDRRQIRRTDQGDGFGRRAAQSRSRQFLSTRWG